MPKPYHRNPRQITKKRANRLADTLTRLGDLGGIVHNLRTDEIIGGNQRTAVFGQASEVQIIEQYDTPDEQGTVAHGFVVWQGKKYSYRQVDWNEETAAEANIAANIGAGEWDWSVIANEWQPAELTEWGFDESLLTNWRLDVASLGNFLESEEQQGSADAEPQISRADELQKVWGTAVGQLWAIGEHRLFCGDSTDANTVTAVLDGDVPLLMVTDPPYGVEYDADWRNELFGEGNRATGTVNNDDVADWSLAYCLFPGDIVYCWHNPAFASVIESSLEKARYFVRSHIMWSKPHFVVSRGHYHARHESCWYAVKRGKGAKWIGPNNEQTVWDIHLDQRIDGGHSTQKPLECMARPIRNHDAPIIYDPFGGSGTTMVACQNLGRKCRMIELDLGYTAVIIQRMVDAFPGITAELIGTI